MVLMVILASDLTLAVHYGDRLPNGLNLGVISQRLLLPGKASVQISIALKILIAQ